MNGAPTTQVAAHPAHQWMLLGGVARRMGTPGGSPSNLTSEALSSADGRPVDVRARVLSLWTSGLELGWREA